MALALLMPLDALQLELVCSNDKRPFLLGITDGILPAILAEHTIPLPFVF